MSARRGTTSPPTTQSTCTTSGGSCSPKIKTREQKSSVDANSLLGGDNPASCRASQQLTAPCELLQRIPPSVQNLARDLAQTLFPGGVDVAHNNTLSRRWQYLHTGRGSTSQ